MTGTVFSNAISAFLLPSYHCALQELTHCMNKVAADPCPPSVAAWARTTTVQLSGEPLEGCKGFPLVTNQPHLKDLLGHDNHEHPYHLRYY